MNETVLLYNFKGERLKSVKAAALPLKIRTRVVDKSELNQPIGCLAGIKGFEPCAEDFTENGFDDEMLVMSGFTGERMNALIQSLYRHGLGRIDLKAVVTTVNVSWNSVELYEAVKADHEEMAKRNGSKV